MNGTRVVERVRVTTGDRQVASHVGLHLLGEIAERTGLAFEYPAAVPFAGERAPVHDRGRLLSQLAVMLGGRRDLRLGHGSAAGPTGSVRAP
jgi:hypothetical protein